MKKDIFSCFDASRKIVRLRLVLVLDVLGIILVCSSEKVQRI